MDYFLYFRRTPSTELVFEGVLRKGNCGTNRGSLFHIRNTFGHRNVTKDVIKSFNYNAELLEFSTRDLTVLLAPQNTIRGNTSNSRYLSLVMRKPAFCLCENKDADQLRGNREADQRLCFRYTDSTIPLLPQSEILSL